MATKEASATRVNRAELLRTLESLRPGLAGNRTQTTEQSSCFLFRKGRVLSFNGEVCCRSPSKLPEDLTAAVQARPLLDALTEMGEDDVNVSCSDGIFLITTDKRTRVRLKAEGKILAPVEAVAKPEKWFRLPQDFREAVAMAAEVYSTIDTRLQLNAVHVTPDCVESNDYYRILHYRTKTGFSKPALLKRESVEKLPDLEVTEAAESEGWVHFRNPSKVVVSARNFAEDFDYPPDLSRFFDFRGEPLTTPKGLVDAAKLAAKFVDKDTSPIDVELAPGRITVKADGIYGDMSKERKVKYVGPPRQFRVGPKTLAEIAEKSRECEVADGKLKIDGGRWLYFACLSGGSANGEK